jgi:hypothetical protein
VVGRGEAGVVGGVGEVVAHASQGMERLRHGRIDQGEPAIICSTTLLACSAAVWMSESGLMLAGLIAQVFVEVGVVEQDGLDAGAHFGGVEGLATHRW